MVLHFLIGCPIWPDDCRLAIGMKSMVVKECSVWLAPIYVYIYIYMHLYLCIKHSTNYVSSLYGDYSNFYQRRFNQRRYDIKCKWIWYFCQPNSAHNGLTHWGRVAHICVSKLTIIGSDNGLLPGRRQAIIWANAVILLVRPMGTNFTEILIEIELFSFMKVPLKMSSGKCRPFCLCLNVLIYP